jgi:hypothetical protein
MNLTSGRCCTTLARLATSQPNQLESQLRGSHSFLSVHANSARSRFQEARSLDTQTILDS